MAMRAGRALRDRWADEARYAADPDYYARHWRAGELRAEVIRRYGASLLAAGMEAADALPLVMAADSRVRVVEQNRQFRVTAHRKA